MDILITGGAGFIGSTIASAALDAGHRPIILDNLETGRREFTRDRIFYEGDIADAGLIKQIFRDFPEISVAIHCAALIVVPESVEHPVAYYRANVTKTLELVAALTDQGCHRLIFSSSASIYQPDDGFTVDEASALAPLSPYARTKVMVEWMLQDIAAATPLQVISLRYFNPIGADPKMRTGLQLAAPSHALGQLIRARQKGAPFHVTGDDFPTHDGSGIRDYVHVWDLAVAHVAALNKFDSVVAIDGDYSVVNLGTGQGTTVRELIAAFERVTGETVDVKIAPRRPGDSVGAFTRSAKAAKVLNWTPYFTLDAGIADTLAWFAQRAEVLPDLAE